MSSREVVEDHPRVGGGPVPREPVPREPVPRETVQNQRKRFDMQMREMTVFTRAWAMMVAAILAAVVGGISTHPAHAAPQAGVDRLAICGVSYKR